METVDCVVIGAGVIGLAIARALALTGHDVLILERAGAIGTETSARNSEVIHAGLYYPPGSLRAALCVQGRDQLYAYLAERQLPHRAIGKLVVATDTAQIPKLAEIAANAAACGARALRILSRAEALAMEPALHCEAALWSPKTGILDTHALMLSLLADAEGQGATLALGTTVTGMRVEDGAIAVTTEDGFTLRARTVVNAAGLWAPALAAATEGLPAAHVPVARFARGTWFTVPGRAAFFHLIYPVPEPGGLGIHVTLDLAGGMRFGPNVEWIDGIDYQLKPDHAPAFAASIRRYWPGLPEDALTPVSCGVRPKLHGPDEPAADFRIDGPARHGIPGLVNLFGIESPGLTSCLAIGAHVAGLLAPGRTVH